MSLRRAKGVLDVVAYEKDTREQVLAQEIADLKAKNQELIADNTALGETIEGQAERIVMDTQTATSARQTLDFQWQAIERLKASQGEFGGYVIGLLKQAEKSPELAISAESRARDLARAAAYRDMESLKVRQMRGQAEQQIAHWMDEEGGRDEIDAELTAKHAADGTYDAVREQVKWEVFEQREAELAQQVVDAATAEANSPEAIAKQRAEITDGLEADGTIGLIQAKALSERKHILSLEVIEDAKRAATTEYEANSDQIRARLEQNQGFVAHREVVTKRKIAELNKQSIEDFVTASTDKDPELAAYIQEQATAHQREKMFAEQEQEIVRLWERDKRIDLQLAPKGMKFIVQGSVAGTDMYVKLEIQAEGDGEFVVNDALIDGLITDADTEQRVHALIDMQVIVGRAILQRSGDEKWITEIQKGTVTTIRSDLKGENDVRIVMDPAEATNKTPKIITSKMQPNTAY